MSRKELYSPLEKITASLEKSKSLLHRFKAELETLDRIKQKRILVINNLYPPQELGGYGRSISSFARILQERGHIIQVLSSNASYLGEIITPESNIRRDLILTGDYKGGMNVLQDHQEINVINNHNKEIITDTIRNFKPDVCLVGNIQLLGTAIFDPFFQNNIPIIHHLGFAFLQYAPLEKPTSRFYHLSAASEYVKHSILKTYNFDDISVIYPGAFVQKFYKQRHSNHFDKLRIVFAGIVINTKGIHTLLEALKILDSYFHVDFECSIAGDINYDKNFVETLQSFVAANELMSKVKFLGYQSQEQLVELFSRHNILVFPSIAEEAFGISPVEAMAAGLLVITTGVGGAGEVVEDGVSGLRFPPENSEVLARQLYGLLSEPDRWELIAKNGQQRALRFFDINRSVDLLEQKFYELLYPSATKPMLQDQNPIGLLFNNDDKVTENTYSNKILWSKFQDFTYSKKSHLKLFRQFGFYLGVSPEKYDPIFDLKFYQDLLVYNFITDNFQPGAKLLEVGGGNSRVIKALKHDYECWNVDKLDGIRTGPTRVDEIDGYYLVRSYIGDFCSELPEEYFDCVFSISALEHTPEDEDTFKKVLEDIDRVLAPDGISLHCFDVHIRKYDVWTNKLLPYLFKNVAALNQMIPFSEVRKDSDLYGMSETSYKRWWQSTTQQNYEVFGKTISYNILWQKQSLRCHPSQNQSVIHPQINRVELMVRDAFPKISVVTPSYNQSEFLEECIDSVLGQGYPNLEYVIIDDGSQDKSVEIIKKYEKHLAYWHTHPNQGQYGTISCGFSKTTGQIMAWLNSDDKFHPDAFFKVATVFNKYQQVEWLMGRPTGWNKAGIMDCIVSDVPKWSREYILSKKWLSDNFWIQQESTFWKRTLWEKAGAKLRIDFKIAGDFELWLRFSRYAQLFFVDTFLAGFRSYESNRSKLLWEKYMQEIDQAINEELILIKRGLYTNSLPAPQTIFLNDEELLTIKKKSESSESPIHINQKVKVNQEFLSKQREFTAQRPAPKIVSNSSSQTSLAKTHFKVSAIVSTYNSEEFIRGCLQDLVDQSLYKKGYLEIIVIDSASEQNEQLIIREFQSKYPNIIYERTLERETLYASWNRGIKIARGDYITNANTDDRHRPDALEVMASYLDVHPGVSLVYADQLITHVANDRWATTQATETWNWPVYSYSELEKRCIIGPQPLWRKSLHNKYGYFRSEFKAAGDYEFWLRIGKTEKLVRLPEVLGLYYFNPQGLSTSGELGTDETHLIWNEYRDLDEKPVLTPKLIQPFVSVIIPTKDRPEMLAQAIQSVLNQTFTELEIIVVNDGGVDVQSVISRLNTRGNIVYKKLDRALERSAARNTGIRAARGKYIAYLDDDDNYYPNHIETLVKFLENSEYKIAYTDAVMAQQEKQNGEYVTLHRSVPYSLDFDKDKILVSNCTPNLCLMHEKSCLDEVGLFDETLSTHEDWDLIIRLSRKFDIAHIKETTCEFTQRNDGTNTSSHNRADFTRTREIIFNRYQPYAEANSTILDAQKDAFIAEAKELAQQVQQIQAQFTQSLDKLQSQLEEKESHLQQTQAEKSQLAAQVESWQHTTQEVQAKLDATQSEKEWVKSQLNSWKQTAEEMQLELDRSRLKLKQAQLELDRSAFPLSKS